MSEPSKEKKSGDSGGYVLAVALVAVLFLAVPAALAVVAYAAGGRRLRRLEATFIGLTAATIFALDAKGNATAQALWLASFVHPTGGATPTQVPYLPLLLLAAVLMAVLVLVRDTAKLNTVVSTKLGRAPKAKLPGSETPSVVPTLAEKERISIAPPPGGPLVVDATVHSIAGGDVPVGKRSFPLGVDQNGVPVTLSEDEIRMHGLIFGSTGSGKTETIKAFVGGLLDLGWNAVILDMKEDIAKGGLRDWCSAYASNHAIPYQELCVSDPDPRAWLNPLEGMNSDEAADTILSMEVFPDAFWEAINKKTLRQTCSLLFEAHAVDPTAFPAPSPLDIGRLLEAPDLKAASKKMRAVVASNVPGRTDVDFSALANPSKDEASAAVGFGARLTGVYNSIAGRTVLRAGDGKRMLDVSAEGLVYVGASSSSTPELARMTSSSVLRRLAVLVGQRTRAGGGNFKPTIVVVDEANFVNREVVLELLSRARSAGIHIFLATQGPNDYELNNQPGAPGFSQLAQNANVAIIMSQGEEKSAEVCADYIGKTERSVLSQSVRDGEVREEGSLRAVRDHVVSPEQLRHMGIGEAVLRVGKPGTRVQWMRVAQRPPEARARR